MGSPIRSRLFLSYLAVLLVGMGLAAGLVWRAVEGAYIATQSENLLAQARLTAAALQGAPLPLEAAQPYMQTTNVMPGIHTRILSEGGAVVIGLPMAAGDTPVAAPAAENSAFTSAAELLQRPEIQQAMQGQAASAVRKVATAGNRGVLYAAAPIPSEDGEVAGIVYLAMPLPAGGLPASLLWQLAGGLLVAILLASVAGTLLARRLAQPVEAVAEAAQSVAAGDLNQSVPVDSNVRELKGLGEAFNHMTASLRQSEQAKNTFIADVTHELRTPLTVIKGTIETLEDGAVDDIEGRGPLLSAMGGETERLIRLVDDLLVLTRADAGALKLRMAPLDLGEVARGRCERLMALAARRGVRLEVDESTDSMKICVLGDADRLAQVLDNLLDNAIRHTAEGSIVRVDIRQTGDEIQCAVSDQGAGIPAEHLPNIFERFYRVDSSRDRARGGAGLGLAIARALVLAQGGRIEAQSAAGEGTVITFWLPLDVTAAQLPAN